MVLGDAAQDFTHDDPNAAFRLLMEGAPLLALGAPASTATVTKDASNPPWRAFGRAVG
jgi:hypothetical protein